MEIGNLIPHIEALIFASEKPLTAMEITELVNNAFGFMEDKLTMEQIQTAIDGIVEKYRSEFYPFEIRESGGGWQFLTKGDYHKTVAQLNGDKFLKRLSTAALETLSIIAYKQPVTKAEIEAIRGVSSDYAIQKLLEKELIMITGRNEKLPGHPLVYATSKNFMDYFGINSAEDLPRLKEVFDESLVDPTVINGEAVAASPAEAPGAETAIETADPEGAALLVSENGELIEEALAAEAGESMEETEIAGETGDPEEIAEIEEGRETEETLRDIEDSLETDEMTDLTEGSSPETGDDWESEALSTDEEPEADEAGMMDGEAILPDIEDPIETALPAAEEDDPEEAGPPAGPGPVEEDQPEEEEDGERPEADEKE